jgi:hypothetical protein
MCYFFALSTLEEHRGSEPSSVFVPDACFDTLFHSTLLKTYPQIRSRGKAETHEEATDQGQKIILFWSLSG